MSGLTTRITIIAAAVGAAAALSVQPLEAVAAPERQCFNADTVSGFSAYDDDAVYVRVTRSKVFKLEVLGSCPNLAWTQGLGLDSRVSSFVCAGSDVDLIVPQDGMGPPLRCAVRAVSRLTQAEIDALPKGRRP